MGRARARARSMGVLARADDREPQEVPESPRLEAVRASRCLERAEQVAARVQGMEQADEQAPLFPLSASEASEVAWEVMKGGFRPAWEQWVRAPEEAASVVVGLGYQ